MKFTITELRAKIKDLLDRMQALRDLAVNENRNLSDDEAANLDGWIAQVEDFEADIARQERMEAVMQRNRQPARESSRPDPANLPDGARVEVGDDRRGKDTFRSFGEQLRAVAVAGQNGPVDPRLLNQRAASGLNEGVPSEGGFLVQHDFATTILKNVWDNGVLPSRINKISISGNANGMKMNGLAETSRADGSRAGGIQSYWAAEAAEKTASKPSFRQIKLELNKLIGLCYATDELLQDASALESVISTGFRDEFDYKISDAIINGTGAGQPLGILNAGCMVSVSKEAGQAADTIVFENIVKMWSRLLATSRSNAVWLINQDCEPQLHSMSLAVGTGGVPVYMPAGGLSGAPYATLYGRPVIAIEQCQTVGTTGDIYLGDFSKYIGIEKGGLQQASSMHVRFVYDEMCFRFVYRFDGQPVLASAITPAHGTNTLSHFVKLDSRD